MASTVTTSPGVRDRLVQAAAELTCDAGWSAVTMNKVAARAGVSRQTVYNELGSKPALGQAMVLRELDRFLAAVEEELDGHDDLVEAIRAAAQRILVMAAENPLLHAVLSSAHSVSAEGQAGASTDLLPFLTTEAEPLIGAAKQVIAERVPGRYPDLGLSAAELDVATDAIVRLVLSHVMQPGGDPVETSDGLAWIVGRVLGRSADQGVRNVATRRGNSHLGDPSAVRAQG
jgi:AcrR family transcriptional regulator